MNKKYIPYLLMLPIMIYTLLLIVYPLVFSAVLAFKKFDPISGLSLLTMKTVGWKNFSRNFGDNAFYESLYNTVEIVVIGVIVQFFFSFLLALALHKKTTLYSGTALTLILTPLVVPMVASGLTWRMLFHLEYGAINGIIGFFGFEAVNFLGDPSLVRLSIILVDTWQWTPFMFLLLLAGLLSLPKEPFLAASVDGAGPIRKFIYVTFPLMAPISIGAIIIRLIEASKIMDTVYVLTSGGPGTSTETSSYYIFVKGLREFQFGYSAALSFTYLIIMIISLTIISKLLVKILIKK